MPTSSWRPEQQELPTTLTDEQFQELLDVLEGLGGTDWAQIAITAVAVGIALGGWIAAETRRARAEDDLRTERKLQKILIQPKVVAHGPLRLAAGRAGPFEFHNRTSYEAQNVQACIVYSDGTESRVVKLGHVPGGERTSPRAIRVGNRTDLSHLRVRFSDIATRRYRQDSCNGKLHGKIVLIRDIGPEPD